MGAAFAYNSLFAVVPLALAFVSVLTLLDTTQKLLGDAEEFINEALPADIADFLNQILRESFETVANNRLVIIVVTLLVALWSGSRAVYTVQKALRFVEDSEVEVGYLHMRASGILVTIGGGVGVVAAYALLVLGRGLTDRLASLLPWGLPLGQFLLAGVAAVWIFILLFAVYRWGAPQPIRRPAATSALVTTVLFVGTWVGFSLVPSETAVAVAVFGTIGLVLLWLYGIGVVVVAGPIAVGSLLRVLEERTHR